MVRNRPQEKGQILIIFFFALVALLGLTALAIDGGMIYADRRFDQAAADASSLAGAGSAAQLLEKYAITWNTFHCTAFHGRQAQKMAFQTAKNRGVSNAFANLDNNLSDEHGIKVTCVNNEDLWDKHIDVRTQITSQISTAFAHLFFPGPIKNTVDSVARIRPRTFLAYGYAIASLGTVCETKYGGTTFDGTADVYINGGGVFSNTCLDATGGVRVHVNDGEINYYTTYSPSGGALMEPAPQAAPKQLPINDVPLPSCGAGAPVTHNGGGEIGPGNYSSIKVSATGNVLTLQPGLYCLTGDFSALGGTLNAEGVTIFMKKNGVDFTSVNIAGGVEAHMSAAKKDSAGEAAGAIPGIFIYSEPGNEGAVSLQGNSASTFVGAVFAQDAPIAVGGTTGVNPTYNTQLIGAYVKVHGTSKIDINFNNFEPWSDPPRLDQLD